MRRRQQELADRLVAQQLVRACPGRAGFQQRRLRHYGPRYPLERERAQQAQLRLPLVQQRPTCLVRAPRARDITRPPPPRELLAPSSLLAQTLLLLLPLLLCPSPGLFCGYAMCLRSSRLFPPALLSNALLLLLLLLLLPLVCALTSCVRRRCRGGARSRRGWQA